MSAAPADTKLDRAWRALGRVRDPELPVLDIVELGMVRAVERRGDGVAVTIIPTYSGCPALHGIQRDIRTALAAEGFAPVAIDLAHDQAWSTDRMADSARRKLAAIGVAPPVGRPAARRALFGADPVVACPRCGSSRTRRLSAFGSTACTALHVCDDCRDPFDHFKCA